METDLDLGNETYLSREASAQTIDDDAEADDDDLFTAGLCGSCRLVEAGGVQNLVPLPMRDKVSEKVQ